MEREQVQFSIKRGMSARATADWLGRHHSVVAREIARNGGRDQYRALRRNGGPRCARRCASAGSGAAHDHEASQGTGTIGKIKGMILISERSAEAEDRAVGGDLIIGKDSASQIATLVERTTRYVELVRIPCDRNAERVAHLLAEKMNTLPELFKNGVTWNKVRK